MGAATAPGAGATAFFFGFLRGRRPPLIGFWLGALKFSPSSGGASDNKRQLLLPDMAAKQASLLFRDLKADTPMRIIVPSIMYT